jgi:ubiquinone/menaquinone biosynthesis C-methylase UbiE
VAIGCVASSRLSIKHLLAVNGVQVVDVGGGTGFCTLGIVQAVHPTNVTLMDQSPHQLAKARAKPALAGVTIIEVRTPLA